jgi:hypothetical protein
MTHLFDVDAKHWDSETEGTIKEFTTDTEIPVTVFLQWFEGGWNRVYEVRVGAVNTSNTSRELAKEYFGPFSGSEGRSVAHVTQIDSKFAKDSLKEKSPYFSDIPLEFLEKVPTIVSSLQRNMEGTRQAVQLLRDSVKRATSSGSLNKHWQDADENERALVAYTLKELLYEAGVHAYRNEAYKLLNFKDSKGNPISLATFNRMSVKGERAAARQKKNIGSK